MLTSKEAQYLSENIQNENLLVTKFGAYAKTATDPVVRQVCTDIQNCHRQHINMLSSQVNA